MTGPTDPQDRSLVVSSLDEVKQLLGDVLRLGKRRATLTGDSRLFGSLAELDSMALVKVVVAIEERFGLTFEDEDITAEAFATLRSLAQLVDRKRFG